MGPCRRPPSSASRRSCRRLERILASHALLHAAEGVLYREAVQDACAAVGVATTFVAPKTVVVEAEEALGWTAHHAAAWLATTGKALGPPWTKDHKDATLAAAIVLASG